MTIRTINKHILLFIFFLSSIALAYDDGDIQSWGSLTFEKKLHTKWTLYGSEQGKLGNKSSEFFLHRLDAGIVFDYAKWAEFSLCYKNIHSLSSGIWKTKNVPHFNATFKWVMSYLELQDRNRFEWQMPVGGEKSWRYRNKLKIAPATKWSRFAFQPYIADEIFVVRTGDGGLNTNRTYLGVAFKLTKYTSPEFYYMLQEQKAAPAWVRTNVLGASLKFSF